MSTGNKTELPSERSFGLLFTAVFSGLAVYGYVKNWDKIILAAWLTVAGVICLITLLSPRLLAPFNKAWFQFGQLLGKIVSPIVLGIIFFGILTPVALLTRLFGRDELRLKRQTVSSYWIERTPPSPTSDSFKNQF